MFKHILVPTDGSEFSKEVTRRAVKFAKEAGAQITALYARPPFRVVNYSNDMLAHVANVQTFKAEQFEEQAEAKAQSLLGFIERMCKESGVSCEKLSPVSDDPYKAIIDAAEQSNCDLIFMASHGRKGLQGFLLGSETQKVLTHSTIPVLVYRPPRLPTDKVI